jgi:hypothetical protein
MNSSLSFILSVQLRNMVKTHEFHCTANDRFFLFFSNLESSADNVLEISESVVTRCRENDRMK